MIGVECFCPECGKKIRIPLSKNHAKKLYKAYKGVVVKH